VNELAKELVNELASKLANELARKLVNEPMNMINPLYFIRATKLKIIIDYLKIH